MIRRVSIAGIHIMCAELSKNRHQQLTIHAAVQGEVRCRSCPESLIY
jgi:hypothetical protein